MRIITLILSLAFVCNVLNAQTPQRGGFSGDVFLPIDMSDKRGSEALTNVNFLLYPYAGNKIDMRDFKKQNKDIEIDDWVEINPPSLAKYNEVNVLIGRVEGVEPTDKAVIIWLVADYSTSKVTFFFDNNVNRDFLDENHSKVLKPNKPYRVEILPHDESYTAKTVELAIPKREKPKKKDVARSKIYKSDKEKIWNQIAVGFHASVGSAKQAFMFDNLELGFPTWYDIDYTQKGIGLNVSYSLPWVRLGVNGTYQNHFYYTSYLNEQFGEPRVVVNPRNGRRTVQEQVRLSTNQDVHERNHFQYGAELALRIHLSERVEIQPFATYGQYAYSGGEYISDKHEADTKTYELPSSNTYELGLRFEFATGGGRAIHIDAMMQEIDWAPQAYFDTFQYENLTTSNRVYKLLIGYRFGL